MAKIPTPIVDKNGKQTTVHKNTEQATPARAGKAPTAPLTVPENVDMELADGTFVSVPSALSESFRGVVEDDFSEQCLVVSSWVGKDGSEHLLALTPCCNATGKGLMDEDYGPYVGCRGCYSEVGSIHAVEILPGSYTPLAG